MKTRILFVLLISLLLGLTQSVKADTITYQVPGTAQVCQNPLAYDAFVFHKPIGFGSTVWYIGGTLIGSGDSIIFTPSAPGDYVISATWNSNVVPFMLSIYSAPPSHATFSVMSGGSMNSTNDTLWMCGTSVSVLSNTIGSEATSYTWYTSGGLTNSSDDPILLNVPGMHVFERINPCGVTRDTFYLVQLPTEAPVWTDMIFCNAPVNLTLDPGPGWNYLWNTGETTQTLAVSDSGLYKVKLSNQCVVLDSAWIQISQVNFPLPDLALYSQIPASVLCQSEVAILDPNTGYTYDTYQWYKNGSISVGNQPTLTVDYPALGDGSYSVEVTQGGCSATSITMVMFYLDPQAPTHCVSSFDPLTGTNMTVFEVVNEPEVTEYVLSYKQGSTWMPVDTIAETGLSSYTLYDAVNDPNQQSQTYAVFSRHLCGNLSPLVDWHKTIRIAIFQDVISSDYVLQIMDDYETMGGYTPDSYTIWIDSLNDGNLSEIGILNGGNSSFTISAPVNGAAYYASVNLPWTCNTTKSANVSFSNKRVFSTSSVSENTMQTLTIYPNPATNQITISGIEPGGTLRLYDLSGKLLLERVNKDNTLELGSIAAGSYVLEMNSERGVVCGRVVVE